MIATGTSVALTSSFHNGLATSSQELCGNQPESSMLLKTPCGVGDSNNPGADAGKLCGVSKTIAGEAVKDRKITVLKASPVMDGQTVTQASQEGLNDQYSVHTQHDRIKQLLNNLENTCKRENANLSEMTTTDTSQYKDDSSCMYTWTPKDKLAKYGSCRFINTFTPTTWYLKSNFKSEKSPRNSFYLSNVIAMQYEKCFTENQWPFQLPETIHRCDICNKETDQLIRQYADQHNTKKFMDDYLQNTVNGKSTVRIADCFGLDINRLTVIEGEQGRNRSALIDDPSLPRKWFTVIAHVSAK